MKSIKNSIKQLKGKTVFLRVDFNVPIKKGKILSEKKIIAVLPTIRFLLRYRCKLIIGTHLGNPKGKKAKEYSTKPIAVRFGKIIPGKKIKFIPELTGHKIKKEAEKMKENEILFLENLRFDKGEEKNSSKFALQLAEGADVYVNDAFSVSHRKHASVAIIKKYLPSFLGILAGEEIKNLNKIKNPAKPLVIVMGGAKINTKINLIKKLEPKSAKILIGGALANNFLRARGLEVGKSLTDKPSLKLAKKLKSKKIILPLDAVISDSYEGKTGKIKNIKKIDKKDVIVDIGPETIKLYSDIIKKAKTIVWNGPLGYFENPHFCHGTKALAQLMAVRSRGKIFGVAGGGETNKALAMTKMEDYFDWISTGGGAMLAYLGGKEMPGLL